MKKQKVKKERKKFDETDMLALLMTIGLALIAFGSGLIK